MRPLSRSQVIGVLALLGILVVITGVSVVRAMVSAAAPGITLHDAFPQAPAAPPPIRPADGMASAPPHEETDSASSSATALHSTSAAEVVVHVAGAVKKPGVYHLKPGARGEDALKAAGGPTADANTDAINLAAKLDDGTQLYFPTRQEQPTGGASSETIPAPLKAKTSKKSGEAVLSLARSSGRNRSGSDKPAKLSDPSQGTVNINTATAEELQRLPGVGPAMAARILAYRQQNHGFKRVEDLLEISGIGDKKFAKLQPFVRVH